MFRNIRNHISIKFTLYVLGFVLIFVLSVSIMLFRQSVRSMESEAFGRLEQMTRAYSNEMDVQLTNTMQLTDTIATLIQERFNRENMKKTPGYLDELVREFDPYIRVFAQEYSMAHTAYFYFNPQLDGAPHDIYYVDFDNDGLVTRQEQLPASYFDLGASPRGDKDWWFGPIQRRGEYWTKPYKWVFDDGKSTVFVSHTQAVFDKTGLVAVAGTDFNYQNLVDLIGKVKVYDHGYAFLLNDQREFLINPPLEGAVLGRLSSEPYSTLKSSLDGTNHGNFSYKGQDGQRWIVSYHLLKNNWVLGLAAPMSEVTRSAETFKILTISILLACFPLVGLLSWLVARSITRPVLALTRAVTAIEQGNYGPDIPTMDLERTDELGHLGNAIQQMATSLQSNFEEIRQKNAQLEQEIQEKIEARSRFNMVYEALSATESGMVIANGSMQIIHANPAFIRLLKLESLEAEERLDMLLQRIFPGFAFPDAGWAFCQREVVLSGDEGGPRYLSLVLNRLEERDVAPQYIGILQDQTESVRQARNIEYLQHHDTLTGLLNKDCFMESAGKILDEESLPTDIYAWITVNVDDFRLINEAMGYECGDYVILQITDRIRRILQPEDLFGRSSGDEFLVFIRHVGNQQELEALGRSILQSVREPIPWREKELFISLRLGIAVYPFNTDELDKLLVYSAAALNHAKSIGKNTMQYYSPTVMDQSFERYELSNRMREAMERGEFFLMYQPIVALDDERLVAAEALIRWRHPEKGVLNPKRFIYLAEHSGFIERLGQWVIEEGCRQLSEWRRLKIGPQRLSVNLSPLQLNDAEFTGHLKMILRRYELPESALDVEITESALMLQNGVAEDNIFRLKDMGVSIHIDDFGTGFSSLSYLRNFHVDALKIDQSFIRSIPESDAGELARMIIDLSRSLGIGCIAEGIETEEQLRFLKEHGCSYGQGYLFGQPLMPSDFLDGKIRN